MENKITYSEAIEKLEKIIEQMQQPSCPVEQLNSMAQEAFALIKICKAKLYDTDSELQKLIVEIAKEN